MSTITTEAPVAPSETIVTAAAKALDDRKSKLAFAKQVEKSREEGVSDENFATALLTARVELAYGEGADIEVYGKDFPMSASKVSNYGTTINQLREAKAPLTEETYADWFKLVTTGKSAQVRKDTIAFLLEPENQALGQGEKAQLIRKAREEFFAGRTSAESDSSPRRLTLDGVLGYLEKVTAQDWDDTDKAIIVQAMFDAASALDDGKVYTRATQDEVESEQVAA